MKDIIYENHSHKDPNFPIIFHCDTLGIDNEHFIMHYHENIEILYFFEGSATLTCGTDHLIVSSSDIVIINSNTLHSIHCTSSEVKYHCLIVDKIFCESFDITIGDITLTSLIQDTLVVEYITKIIEEMSVQDIYYKSSVKSIVIDLLIYLCRHYTLLREPLSEVTGNQKIKIVKKTISHIKKHFLDGLSIDDICKHIGFSKYYLCRVFKEITGQTILDYINFLRCDYARKLLSSGEYNVSESAEKSGFNNLSYFSKTYKKYMGILPSLENKYL